MASSLRTGSGSGWTAAVRRILQHFSSSQRPGSSAFRCLPLMVEGQQVGLVVPAVARELRAFPEVFVEAAGCLELRGGRCPEERTEAVAQVLARLRAEGRLARLAQWRDEAYEVRPSFGAPALLRVERAAAPLLGILQFGAHLNAFVQRPAEGGEPASWETRMWLARRSPHKATYPGLLDNLAAGGISAGLGVEEALVKESWEEARLPPNLAAQARPVGCLSYAYEEREQAEPRAVVRECLFVFDLQVPQDFSPQVGDGEVQEFHLWPLDKVREAVSSGSFKPNCALVVLDFLLRHGLLHPDQGRESRQNCSPGASLMEA
uniref:Nudix hydrolase domain-containing protein n=1 Tax=Monodelphis domestica TaxID=13616 RepID=K7E2L0_MONDO